MEVNGVKKHRKIAFVLLLTMVYTILCGFDSSFDENTSRVFDEVGYFSETEKKELQQYLTMKAKEAELDFAVCVVSKPVSGDPEDESNAEAIYDSSGLGYDDGASGAMLYINLHSRYAYICTTGIAIWYIDDYDIEDILDDIWDEIEAGDYCKAAKYFADDVTIIANKFMDNDEEGIEVWRDNEYTSYEDFYYDFYRIFLQ